MIGGLPLSADFSVFCYLWPSAKSAFRGLAPKPERIRQLLVDT